MNNTHAILASMLVTSSLAAGSSPRERSLFNENWRFQKGDPKEPGDSLNYLKNPAVKDAVIASSTAAGVAGAQRKLGETTPYTLAHFDDASWRNVTLPHDWGIEGPFAQNLPGETGKLPWAGTGWYRKTFAVPASDAGKQFYLDIDGAMSYSTVWCNGQFVGGWPYGYSSFRIDLTPCIKPGQDNVVAIRLENPGDSSRWYPGSGLYRNVWLVKTHPVHIAYSGTSITTPEVSDAAAKVAIHVAVENRSGTEAKVQVKTEAFLLDEKSQRSKEPVFISQAPVQTIGAGQRESLASEALVANPRRWSLTSPALYQAVTTVTQDGKVVDVQETTFGIRTIEFTADNGFLLNGQRVQLKGVCNHHDLGALGAAFNTRAAERQLEILKEMGVNALRTSHNMPAPELLDLCDRMGIVVMDETFDCWKRGKKGNDYNKLWDDWHEKDLRALIRRDVNHPSVVMWSIGNEVFELGKADEGPALAAALTSIAHDTDPTRPTVLGSNHSDASYNGVQKGVDVMGQNYQVGGYAKFKKENPTIPLVGSETSSCVSSRGEYFFQTPEMADELAGQAAKKAAEQGKPAPAAMPFSPVSEDKAQGRSDFQVSSYDLYAPGWACPPDPEFKGQETNPHVAGEFVWTGFDYLGEPTPYNSDVTNLLNFHDAAGKADMERQLKELGKIAVPSRSSYFGIVDLAGFKKDRFYLYQAHWRPDFPMAHILPHWNWPERVGMVTPVHVYTSGDEAELFLNGKSLGRKKKGALEYRLRWNEVVYEPGELQVVAYKAGREWAGETVKTTGPAAKITLSADRNKIQADGYDLSFITATVADKEGRLVPQSKNAIEFDVSGPGEIVAVDNGDATSFEPFQASRRKAYNGLALVIVRAKKGETGTFNLTAKSEGLASATTAIEAAALPDGK
ncbi:MAG: beta-galactosidase GalB [Verrucomicrobiae bacterium]